MASILDKTKAAIDKAIHPQRHNEPAAVNNNAAANTGATGIAGTSTTTTGSTNAGPHNSNVANKLDPRVDSDLDGSRNAGLNQTTNPSGSTGLTGSHTGVEIQGSTNAGPHNSNIGNTLDPRVDSDLSGGSHGGLNQTTHSQGSGLTGTHHTTTTGTGLTGSSGIGSSGANTTAGPHSSNLANKLDPRVDSDLSGGHPGSNQQYTHTGTTGGHIGTSTTGTGLTGTHATGTHGTGFDGTSTGPVHNSSTLNKLDPRVNTSSGTTGSSTTY